MCLMPRYTSRPTRTPRPSGPGSPRELEWSTPWTKVLDWKPPHAKWFVGGKLNASVNCLDRHVRTWRRNKAAIIWEGEPGEKRTLTYWELYREVCQFANVLRSLGVKKGDRVAIYLPLIPELAIAMLACARIGAVHSVVFGGFSAESLRDRINDQQARLLITADGGYRRGNVVQLKRVADEALAGTPSIENVIVVQRRQSPFEEELKDGRDLWYHDLMKKASADCPPEQMDAEDMLYILYTSGTTGKPKGIVHTTGGYLTGMLCDDEVGVRSQGRRRLLVHGGHRLGHGPQLRRVRPARQRRDGGDVRRRAGLPAQGSLLGHRRALRRDDLLHGADGDPRVHELGHRVAGAARPLDAAAARIGRRADQPRSLDVVPPAHRPRALPDRRHVVADRNRADHDHAAARHHAARSPARRRSRSRASAPRSCDDDGDDGGRRRRAARAHAAVAGDAARHLRRPGPLREAGTWSRWIARTSTSPATAPSATTTAISGCSAAWTTC